MAAPKHDEPSYRLKKINLLVKEGFENSQIGKILAWLLTVGRAIVIIVELVVICAFLSRFWFDKQLTDLIEENTAKRAQIEASSTFEKDYKSIQARLIAVKQIDEIKLTPSTIVNQITKLLPQEVILTNISLAQDKVTLNGASTNEAGLSGFIKSLTDSGKFQNVALANIALDRGAESYIKFIVEATLGGKN